MTTKINNASTVKPETDKPIVVDSTTNPEEQKHEKMERMADRAAHKANKDLQNSDKDHNIFSI